MKALEVDYSVFQLISKGIVLDESSWSSRSIRLERDASGWNLGAAGEGAGAGSGPQGPAPADLAAVDRDRRRPRRRSTITSAPTAIACRRGSTASTQGRLRLRAGALQRALDRVSFRATSPELTLTELTGKLAVRDDNLYVEKMSIADGRELAHDRRRRRAVPADAGRARSRRPARCRCRRSAGSFPAAAGYDLHPTFDVKADGPGRQPGARSQRAVGGRQRARPADGRRQGARLRAPGATSTSSA